MPESEVHTRIPHKWLKRTIKTILGTFVCAAIFILGINVGNGTIQFSNAGPSPQSAGLPEDLNYLTVEQVYDLLRKEYDGKLNETALIEGLKKGLVQAAGDPYTEFLNAEQTKDLNEDLSGTFSGIGAELGKDGENIVIVSPIAGFPAQKAGLKPRDIIVSINDESVYGLTITDAVSKIRGEVGTSVSLKVQRGEEELNFQIQRDKITIPSVESKVINNSIGYIKITRFSEDTTTLAREAAANLKNQGVEGIILDLRGNPGGLLDSAVDVSSLWLANNKVVLQERRGGIVVKDFTAEGNAPLNGLPTVVLIDGGSASASEIVAGALKDNKAATLVGVTTFGKGSVQQIERLPAGSALKVTIARWYTPGGQNIDKQGIEPDVKVEQKKPANNDQNDQQLQQAIKHLR